MQGLDFAYLMLNDIIQSNDYLKEKLVLQYSYDKKYADTRNRGILHVYDISAVQDFYGIGGKFTIEEFVIAVICRTRDRRVLGVLQRELYEKFPAKHYTFWLNGRTPRVLQENVDFVKKSKISSYIDKLTLVDGVSLEKGEVVQVEGGEFEYGFVWGVYDNEAYVFYGEGEYILTKVERHMNYSEREKGFYMQTFDLTGKIIRQVRNL